MRLSFNRLLAGVVLCLSFPSLASTWVLNFDRSQRLEAVIPVPLMHDVTPDTFHYNSQASFPITNLGVTSAVYYQTQAYESGSFAAPSAWQCVSAETITANGDKLNAALAPGRYKANFKAIMRTEGCEALENIEAIYQSPVCDDQRVFGSGASLIFFWRRHSSGKQSPSLTPRNTTCKSAGPRLQARSLID